MKRQIPLGSGDRMWSHDLHLDDASGNQYASDGHGKCVASSGARSGQNAEICRGGARHCFAVACDGASDFTPAAPVFRICIVTSRCTAVKEQVKGYRNGGQDATSKSNRTYRNWHYSDPCVLYRSERPDGLRAALFGNDRVERS